MNTRDFEYLVAIAEELHFGKAAARCHASQPALSGQLQKLEDHLGVTLFERTKRHVRPTEIGEEIVARARRILSLVEEIETVALANKDPFAGACSIGMPMTIGPYVTPLLFPAVKHYVPDLGLELVEDFTHNLEAQLEAGALEMALLATSPLSAKLSEIVLYHEPFWVALPSDHPLVTGGAEEIDVEQIDPSELLLLADGHCLRDQVSEVCKLQSAGSPGDPGPRTQRTSLSTILSLVGSGNGVTLVPAMSLSDAWVTDAGISFRRNCGGRAGRTVRLVFRKGYHRMQLVEKLADIIAGILPDTVQAVRR